MVPSWVRVRHALTTITMAVVASTLDVTALKDISNGLNSNGYARVLMDDQS